MSKNKVTQEQIAKLIAEAKIDVATVQEKCTVVTVTLKSGFILSESSACVDKANYNEEIGARCKRNLRNVSSRARKQEKRRQRSASK